MDTLTAPPSLTTFLTPKPFNPTTTTHHHRTISPVRHLPTTTLPFPQKDNFTPLHSNYSLGYPPPTRLNAPPRASAHRRAASGYAAALIDVAQSNGVVLEVARDVRRLLRVLRKGQVGDFAIDETAVTEFVERAKFERCLVGLVKMVIGRGKGVDIVKETLEEFQRVLSQLSPA